jgi:hypothetical protein
MTERKSGGALRDRLSLVEPWLKSVGALGGVVLILYCAYIEFIPSEVSIGDIFPLLILVIRLALACIGQFVYVLLLGALGWYILKVVTRGFDLILLALVAAWTTATLGQRESRVRLRRAWAELWRPFAVPVHWAVAVLAVPFSAILMAQYVVEGNGITTSTPFRLVKGLLDLAPGLPTGHVVAVLLSAGAALAVYAIVIHFLLLNGRLRTLVGVANGAVVTSPLFRVFGSEFAANPSRANFWAIVSLIALTLLSHPGGYGGLLNETAESAGLRRGDIHLIVLKEDAKAVLRSGRSLGCAFYRTDVPTSGGVEEVRFEGADLAFHGIGKRTLLTLPNFAGPESIELRSENVRVMSVPLAPTRRTHLKVALGYATVYTVLHLMAPGHFPTSPLVSIAVHNDYSTWLRLPVSEQYLPLLLKPTPALMTAQSFMKECIDKEYGGVVRLLTFPSSRSSLFTD